MRPGEERVRTGTMPINPVEVALNVCDAFLRYIFFAITITEPDLASQDSGRYKRQG